MATRTTSRVVGLGATWAILFGSFSTLLADENVFEKRAEVARQNALKPIEKKLATPGGGLDEETWYVLMFSDQAARAENYYNSRYTGNRYWSTDTRHSNSCVKVEGRKAAAEAVLLFLEQSPQAVQKFQPTARDNVVQWNKNWRYRAFRSRIEAEAFHRSLQGPAVMAPTK